MEQHVFRRKSPLREKVVEKTGFENHSVAHFTLSDLLPRSHQHRKRQNPRGRVPNLTLALTCSSQRISTFQILNMRYACLYFSLRIRYSKFLPMFSSRN